MHLLLLIAEYSTNLLFIFSTLFFLSIYFVYKQHFQNSMEFKTIFCGISTDPLIFQININFCNQMEFLINSYDLFFNFSIRNLIFCRKFQQQLTN